MKNGENRQTKDIILEAFTALRIHNASHELTLWAIDLHMALYLADCVKPTWTTLETGCGLTTVALASLAACHYCIVPSHDEVQRIRKYCDSKNISLNTVHFITDRSEAALPKLDRYGFDLCIIDGRHAFPSPFVDFYYMAERLRVGGLLVVDDTCLWTGRILSQFLNSEKEWSKTKQFHNTVVFQKRTQGTNEKEWNAQPFMTSRSWVHLKVFHCQQMIRSLLRLLKARQYAIIYDKAKSNIFTRTNSSK
jgi:hypothetical protein